MILKRCRRVTGRLSPTSGRLLRISGHLWTTPSSGSYQVITSMIRSSDHTYHDETCLPPGIRPDLQSGLEENVSLFKKLLVNPPRSKDDAAALKKGPTEGIRLPFQNEQSPKGQEDPQLRKIPSQVQILFYSSKSSYSCTSVRNNIFN